MEEDSLCESERIKALCVGECENIVCGGVAKADSHSYSVAYVYERMDGYGCEDLYCKARG